MTRPLTVREVVAQLGPEGALTPEVTDRVRAALAAEEAGAPWYLRLLMGIGAWIGTWFMLAFALGFLSLIFKGEIEGAAIVLGLVLISVALWLSGHRRQEFLQVVALVVSLTGQGLFIGGIGSVTESVPAAAIAGLIVSIALIAFFADRVHRFLSTLGIAAALAALTFDARIPHANEALVIGLMAAVLFVWRAAPVSWRSQYAEVVGPVASGAIVSMFALLLLGSFLQWVDLNTSRWLGLGGPVTAAAVLALLWLVHEVFDTHQPGRFGTEAIAASAAVVALAALTWRTPAIATTLLILLLAFDRRSRGLLGLAVAFFLAFGALYYYNLEMTLLQKSGILAGSGVMLLMAWAVVRRLSSSGDAHA